MSADGICLDCGAEVSPRGLAGHQRGNVCAADTAVLCETNRGRVRVASLAVPYLQAARLRVRRIDDVWHPGHRGRAGVWSAHWYADQAVKRDAERLAGVLNGMPALRKAALTACAALTNRPYAARAAALATLAQEAVETRRLVFVAREVLGSARVAMQALAGDATAMARMTAAVLVSGRPAE